MSESIYEWIKPAPVVPEKPPMYRAKASPDAPLAGSTLKVGSAKHAHIGAHLKDTVNPKAFLRAHEKSGHVDTSYIPKATHNLTSKVPPVPRRDERPHRLPPSQKDFITENAIAAMLTEPRYKSKEETNWLAAETFGKVPAYLERVKREVEAEREYVLGLLDQQQMEAESSSGQQTREMTPDERDELCTALKMKWDVVNAKYQQIAHRKISTTNSTQGEIRWKESCEAMMSQLEGDIKKLSTKGPIYVVE